MKGKPASIMMRLATMAGTKFGNKPYSTAVVRFLYGPQGGPILAEQMRTAREKLDFDGHNACHRCVSETRIRDCRTCAYRKGPIE